MTDGEPGMDPRYDPRFQRGYDASRDGDATLPTAAPSAAASGAGAELRPDVELESPDVHAAPGHRRSGARDPAAEAKAASQASREPRVEPAPPSHPAERDDAHPAPDLAPEPDRSEAAALVRSWLIAGWALTVGATAVGAWLLWLVNTDYSYYSGIADPSTEGLRILGWTLAPALVLAGTVGAVVVTAVAASRHDGPRPAEAGEPSGFRRPPAWWALPVIAVVAVAFVAWAVALAVEGNAAGAGITFTPGGNATEGQEARLNTMALGQVAQMLIGPAASAAVAALVAVAVIEAGRAARD